MARILAEVGAKDSARVVFAPALESIRGLFRRDRRPSLSHFSVEEEVKALVAMGDELLASDIARAALDHTERRKILCSIAEALARAGRTDDAIRILTESRKVPTPDDAHPYEALAFAHLAIAFALAGDVPHATQYSREISDPYSSTLARFAVAMALERQDVASAGNVLREGLDAAARLPRPESALPLRALGAWLAVRLGHPEGAELVTRLRAEAERSSGFVQSRMFTFLARADADIDGVLMAESTASRCEPAHNLDALTWVWMTYWRQRLRPPATTLLHDDPWHLVRAFG